MRSQGHAVEPRQAGFPSEPDSFSEFFPCDPFVISFLYLVLSTAEDRFALMRKQMVEQDIKGSGVADSSGSRRSAALLPAESAVFK
jgi:hypothetical protein